MSLILHNSFLKKITFLSKKFTFWGKLLIFTLGFMLVLTFFSPQREPVKVPHQKFQALRPQFSNIQKNEHELVAASRNAFVDFRNCQLYDSQFPCMELLNRISRFTVDSAEQTRQVDLRHLEVDYVNHELQLSFDRLFPGFNIPKYYREAKKNGHRDARYYKENVTFDISATLQGIITSWSDFAHESNLREWWIVHGNLLAWTWNGKVFPWGNISRITFRF